MTAAAPSLTQGDRTRSSILEFLASYHAQNGVAPSLQEIAVGVGLSSHNAVRNHLLVLKARGQVTWLEGRYRTVRVVVPAQPIV